ncbi:MAG: hypothetical protein ABR555_17360 [Pyrinomonadaceae bacterium]
MKRLLLLVLILSLLVVAGTIVSSAEGQTQYPPDLCHSPASGDGLRTLPVSAARN